MIQPGTFFIYPGRPSGSTNEILPWQEKQGSGSVLSPELWGTFTVLLNGQSNFFEIAWRKAVIISPATSFEIERQKMAFIQKLVEIIRKTSTTSHSINQNRNQQIQLSAKTSQNPSD